ncbi:hypothetical protein T492DRAFT_1148752 [Pavlovales sp. CCMP2436]|nr:hypothetical protein T492DRAFT_1148752 [Pavlovales sp. CCMP2436]
MPLCDSLRAHIAGLSLPPYRMVLPTLRACAAPQRFPGKPLGALLAQQWPSLCRVSLKHAPPALCCESLEGIRWKRACVLADQGATLRYCAICSHLDQDLDSPSSFFPSSLPGAPVAGCDGGRGGGGGSNGGENGGGDGGGEVERARKAIRATVRILSFHFVVSLIEWLAIASEWVVLPDCPQHAPLSALQNSLRSGGEGKEGQRQLLRAEGGKDGEGRQWEQAAGRPKPVTVHRACLERAASVREGRATTSIFACPCCAAPLRVGERPARSWAELFGALEAADVRPYARCTLLLVAAVLIGLWALELACVLAEHRDFLIILVNYSVGARAGHKNNNTHGYSENQNQTQYNNDDNTQRSYAQMTWSIQQIPTPSATAKLLDSRRNMHPSEGNCQPLNSPINIPFPDRN